MSRPQNSQQAVPLYLRNGRLCFIGDPSGGSNELSLQDIDFAQDSFGGNVRPLALWLEELKCHSTMLTTAVNNLREEMKTLREENVQYQKTQVSLVAALHKYELGDLTYSEFIKELKSASGIQL